MSSLLKINGTAKIDSALWDIRFISAEMKSKKGDAREVAEPVIDNGGIDLTLKVGVRKPKDEITYEAVIKNAGDIDAEIECIEYPELNEDQAKILEFIATYADDSEISESQEIKSKEEKTIKIVVRFKDISDESLLAKAAYDVPLTFKINYVQEGYNIAGGDMADDGTRAVLAYTSGLNSNPAEKTFANSPIKRKDIETLTFKRSKNPSYKGLTWDASEAKDGSITGYYQDKDRNGLYEVVIDSRSNIYAPVDSSYLFSSFTSLKEIKFNNFQTDDVTTMQSMFEGCAKLTSLDLSGFDTKNVTIMFLMFQHCSSLTNLDLSNFDTKNVTTMRRMFYGCTSLENLDISNFNVEKVTNMDSMFFNCSSIQILKMNNLNAFSLTIISDMFYGCTGLKELYMNNFNAPKLTSVENLFGSKLTNTEKIELKNFNAPALTNLSNMFNCCYKLKELDISGFNAPSAVNMASLFSYCVSLLSIDLSSFDTKNVTSMQSMFEGCTKLTSLDLSGFDTKNVTTMFLMFQGCSSLTNLDLSNFDTKNVTTMRRMFYGCTLLENLDISNFNVEKVTNMDSMFFNCSSLIKLNFKRANFVSGTITSNMFYNVPANVNITVGSQASKDFLLNVRSNLSNITIEA